MHKSITNLIEIEKKIYSKNLDKKNKVKIIAVSKTFNLDIIMPLIKHGHLDFGENKVQEAVEKWTKIKSDFKNISLHMIGKLQTNKVKTALDLFSSIHTIDRKKLVDKIKSYPEKLKRINELFIQVNLGDESQKAGISIESFDNFYINAQENLKIDGLMCLPPKKDDASIYFAFLNQMATQKNLNKLSMGMSSDFKDAILFGATHIRVGEAIMGNRSE